MNVDATDAATEKERVPGHLLGADEHHTEAIFTAANLISFSRVLALIPMIWLSATGHHLLTAGVLGYIGISDYLDGVVARHMGHVSKLGKVLDPICDRIALGGATIILMVTGDLPMIVGVVLMIREVVVSGGVIALGLAGWPPLIKPTWAGKTATLLLMFGIPMFVISESGLGTAGFGRMLAWGFTLPGIALYYFAAGQYGLKAWNLRHLRYSHGESPAENLAEALEEEAEG